MFWDLHFISVFKKCAPNGSLAVYVGTRTLTTDGDYMEPIQGIIVFDKEFLRQNVSDSFRIWGQITLTFRYGREIDEVLGLRFCNDAIVSFKQLWPPLPENSEDDNFKQLTSLQVEFAIKSAFATKTISGRCNNDGVHGVY